MAENVVPTTAPLAGLKRTITLEWLPGGGISVRIDGTEIADIGPMLQRPYPHDQLVFALCLPDAPPAGDTIWFNISGRATAAVTPARHPDIPYVPAAPLPPLPPEVPALFSIEEILALPHHPDWIDGRQGFLWCRFDMVVDKEQLLRAELTWDDTETPDGVKYHSPELLLERNQLHPTDAGRWMRVSAREHRLDPATVPGLLLLSAAELYEKYKYGFARLKGVNP